jgi:hypothetical protein
MSEAITCGVCGDEVAEDVGVACLRCSSPHHSDCWDFNQGCAVFGCGGHAHVAFAERAAALHHEGVTLTETTPAPPWTPWPYVEGLWRRFRSRLPFVWRTVPAGLGGAFVAVFVASVLRADPVRKDEIVAAMLLAGGAYGLVAPFLAPWMLRAPGWLGASAFAASMVCFGIIDGFRLRNEIAIPFFVVVFAAALTFSACVSEVIAGYRTRLGQALGSWGALARGVIAWLAVAFVIVMIANLEDMRFQLDEELLTIALSMGLMGGAVAVPAMEQGKKAFLSAINAPLLPPRR